MVGIYHVLLALILFNKITHTRNEDVLTIDQKSCGIGWRLFGGMCYMMGDKNLTWEQASESCYRDYNGNLATIYSKELSDFVTASFTQNLWIGLNDRIGETAFTWDDGCPLNYTNWERGEPSEAPYGVNEDCVEILIDNLHHGTGKGKWNDLPCTIKLPFLCQKEIDVPSSFKPNIENSTCPQSHEGWKDLGGDYCYYFETKSHYTWHEANFLCRKRGGELISIHSQDEVNPLHNFMPSRTPCKQGAVYIGLYRHNESVFSWEDGSPLEYTNWHQNEPNSVNERCVEMTTADLKWKDVDCRQLRGYICSTPKIFSNQPYMLEESFQCFNIFSGLTLTGIIFCVIFIAALIGVGVHFYLRKYELSKKTSGTSSSQTTCYRKHEDKYGLVIHEDA